MTVDAAGAESLVDLARSLAAVRDPSPDAVERSYKLAGKVVRIRFAEKCLERLLGRALSHVQCVESPPSLTIDVWDSSHGSLAPRLAHISGDPKAVGSNGEAGAHAPGASYHYDDGNLQVLYQPAPNIVSALASDKTQGWFWIGDASRLPYWDRAAPFRHILSWWLSAHNTLFVHGAAVGTPTGGVLLVGRGGSGKSTTSLNALVESRLLFAGDDYVAVTVEPQPQVKSLYCSGKVDADNLARVPHLEALVSNRGALDSEKAVVYLDDYRAQLTSGFPLAAIVIPKLSSSGPQLIPTSSAAALTALAPSTILQRRPPHPLELAKLRQVTQSVPAFVLELGPSPVDAVGAILRLLDELQEAAET